MTLPPPILLWCAPSTGLIQRSHVSPQQGLSARRNVLVHDYIEVDDSIVVDRLKSLGDLEEFVRQVAAYVTGAQPEP